MKINEIFKIENVSITNLVELNRSRIFPTRMIMSLLIRDQQSEFNIVESFWFDSKRFVYEWNRIFEIFLGH
jgi:hypothetical protein